MLLAAVLITLSAVGAEAFPARVERSEFIARTAVSQPQIPSYGGAGGTQAALVVDVRVYGNHSTPTADILALAGPVAGSPATGSLVGDVRRRLERSGRFAGVEVRTRRLSSQGSNGVLLVIVVDEHADMGSASLTAETPGEKQSASSWVPVLNFRDGRYTYGAQFNLENTFGPSSRLSVPVTWGGDRQARVEIERSFENAPVARLAAGGGINHSNPTFGEGDTHGDVWARVESTPLKWLRAGGEARVADGSYGIDDKLTTIGADLVLDTRASRPDPKNGVYAALGFQRLSFDATSIAADEATRGAVSASRMTFDGRAYLGIFRMTVVGVRADAASPNQPMPPLNQNLLYGIPSLRGSDTGSRATDNLAGAAVEMLVPLSPPMNLGQMGVKVFADTTAVYSGDESLAEQRFGRAYGAGIYLDRSGFSMGLDVGWPEQGGSPNAQFQVGVMFH